MSTTDGRYNGWANWETWNVALWLQNEEGVYFYWRDAAGRAKAECPDEQVVRRDLADWLREEVPESGAVGDSVTWHRVDWGEVADAFLED